MRSAPRISVALCTFNGAKYLAQQLQSIAAQSRPPDELVAIDDGSTDETLQILNEFAARAQFECRIAENEQNCGSTRNFDGCINACSGDLIFTADQDDYWLPEKLELLEAEFDNPEVGFAFSNAALVDANRDPLNEDLWDAIGFGRTEQAELSSPSGACLLLRRYAVTGATLGFRSRFRDLISPIPESWVHDGWIALMIRSVAKCAAVDRLLIEYRQHDAQQIGERVRSLFEQYKVAKNIPHSRFTQLHDAFSAARNRLLGQSGYAVSEDLMAHLEQKVVHSKVRADLRTRAVRWPVVLREVMSGRYHRYDLGWKSIAHDLFL